MAIVRSTANAMDEYLHLSCDPCRYTGKTITATKYCEDCRGHLCAVCSNSHLLCDKTRDHHMTYLITRQTGNDVHDDAGFTLGSAGKKCKTHKKTSVSYCLVHKDVCCRTCIETAHKTCRLRVLSDDVPSTTQMFRRGNNDIRNLESNIKRLQERFESARREKQANLHTLNQQNDNYTTAVKAYRRNLNSLLDKLQQNLMRKKDRHFETKVDEIKTCLSTCQSSITVLGEALNKLEIAYRNTDDQQVTVATKKMESVLKRCEAIYEQVEKLPRHYGFHFQAEVNLEKYLKGVQEFGKIKEDYVESNSRMSPRKFVNVESPNSSSTRKPKPINQPVAAINKDTQNPLKSELVKQHETKRQERGTLAKPGWSLEEFSNNATLTLKETRFSCPPEEVIDTADFDDDVIDADLTVEREHSPESRDVGIKPVKVTSKEAKEICSYAASPRKVKLKTKPKQTCDEVIVRLPSDKKTCSITGGAFLPDDKIVLADASNRNIKVFSADLKRFAHLETSSAPRDVTAVSATDILCTMPNDKTIQMLSVAKEMVVKRTYRLDIECYGIDYFQQRLYVSSGWSAESEVHVLDLNGTLLKKIQFTDDVLKCPLYVTVQPESRNVYVSDYEQGVICFDENGCLISRCHNMETRGYMGICCSSSDDVFVSTLQPNGISKVVIYKSSSRPFMSDLDLFIALPNKGGQRPRSIAFSKKTANKMLITFVGQNVDVVNIYTM